MSAAGAKQDVEKPLKLYSGPTIQSRPSFIRSHLLESKAHTYEVDFGRDIGEAVYLFENFDAIFVEHEREQWFDGIYWNGLD